MVSHPNEPIEDTIDFADPSNRVSNALGIDHVVQQVKSILVTHFQQGDRIVLYAGEEITYHGESQLAHQMSAIWSEAFNHLWDEDDCTPQLKISFTNNMFKVAVETYPGGECQEPFSELIGYNEVDEFIKMFVSTGRIYDAYTRNVLC
jgi:hypothetical protein